MYTRIRTHAARPRANSCAAFEITALSARGTLARYRHASFWAARAAQPDCHGKQRKEERVRMRGRKRTEVVEAETLHSRFASARPGGATRSVRSYR